jgi:hypothetical protein
MMTRWFPIVLVLVAACGQKHEKLAPAGQPATSAKAPAPAPGQRSLVEVDPRVELVSIAWRLAGAEAYRKASSPYAKEVDAAFAPYADDPAIAETRELLEKNKIDFDGPISLAVCLDPTTFELLSDAKIDDAYRWSGVDLAGYTAKLKAFAERSHLAAFLGESRRAPAEKAIRDDLGDRDIGGWLATFFHAPRAHFSVAPGLLSGEMNYAHGCGDERSAVIALGLDPILTVRLVVHEMSHSFVNPVIDRETAKLQAAAEQVFALAKAGLAPAHYTTWDIMVKESCVRAATILYAKDKLDDAAVQAEIKKDELEGFTFIPELVPVVAKSQLDPDALAAFFAQLAKDGLPATQFRGPIGAVLLPGHPLAFVAPAVLTSFVERVRAGVDKTAPLVADPTAQTGRSLMIWGSPKTEPFIAEILKEERWVVDGNHVEVAGKSFSGEHLILVAWRQKPGEPQQGEVVLAADDDSDLAGYALREGGFDWVVAQKTVGGFTTVASQTETGR